MSIDASFLESLVTGIKEVTGCAIITDDHGDISEVHVTADSERPPRLIARDVDTLLKVKAGLNVDYRKIGVVIEHQNSGSEGSNPNGALPAKENPAASNPAPPNPAPPQPLASPAPLPSSLPTPEPASAAAAPAPAPAEPMLIIETEDRDVNLPIRVLFDRMSVTHAQGQVQAEVTLVRGERRVVGEASCADTRDGHIAAVVKATLDALLILHRPSLQFAEPRFRALPFGTEEVIVVYLSAVEGRSVLSFSGAAVVRQDPRQAAVLATLSALNRRSGIWPERQGAEFDII